MCLICSASHYRLMMPKHPNFPLVITDVSSDLIPVRLRVICLIMFATHPGEREAD